MATRTRGGTEANKPVRRDSLGEKIAIAEMKCEYLRALGVESSRLDKLLARAKSALASRNYDDAEAHLDELLVFFSVLSGEIDGLVDRFFGASKGKKPTARAQANKGGPTLDEVRETVEDAFLKALHSQNLRRMVEVITLEKLRTVLSDDGIPPEWVQEAVDKALSGRKKTSKKGRR